VTDLSWPGLCSLKSRTASLVLSPSDHCPRPVCSVLLFFGFKQSFTVPSRLPCLYAANNDTGIPSTPPHGPPPSKACSSAVGLLSPLYHRSHQQALSIPLSSHFHRLRMTAAPPLPYDSSKNSLQDILKMSRPHNTGHCLANHLHPNVPHAHVPWDTIYSIKPTIL
jgi:hypothetical protein